MTKPAQDKETLREAIARIIDPTAFQLLAELNRTIGLVDEDGNEFPADERAKATAIANECIAKARTKADAAIATMFERLRTLSEGMIEAGSGVPCNDDVAGGVIYSTAAEAKAIWQAMLAAFQQENSDGR